MFPSFRNQSVDLQSKSTVWFPYDGNIGRQKINSHFAASKLVKVWHNSFVNTKGQSNAYSKSTSVFLLDRYLPCSWHSMKITSVESVVLVL